MPRPILAALGATIVTLGGASSALAANTRYATPTGSGTTCSTAAPCDLVTAVNNAVPSDEIVVAGNQGPYGTPGSPITTTLTDAGSIKLHGAAGQPMPVVYASAAFALLLNKGGSASDLDIEDPTGTVALFVGSGTVDHVIAHGKSVGCQASPDATIVDSVCLSSLDAVGGFSAVSGTHTITLRNVTAIANPGTATGIHLGASNYHQVVNATNVIARGSGSDVTASATGTGQTEVNLDHSNYTTANTAGAATITVPGSGTNQIAAPAFVNAAAGDFHQAPTSPTIDHGSDDPANGTTDLEGKPRSFGAHTDIGADEYAPPSVLSESASSITSQSAAVGASVNSEGGPAAARVEYGPTSAYGSTVALGPPALTASPQALSALVGSLTPATTYHYRIVVRNGSGTATGTDQTFTTAPSPPAAPGVAKASISRLSATNRTFAPARASTPLSGLTTARHKGKRHKRGTVFSFRLDQPATVTIAIQRRARGPAIRCKAFRRKRGHRPRCLRTTTVATLTRTGHAGLNKIAFSGRINGKALKPGRYTAVFTASNGAGTSPAAALTFTIVKR